MTREIREITVLWRRGPCHSLGLTDAEMVYSLLTLTMLPLTSQTGSSCRGSYPSWQQPLALPSILPLGR